MPTGLGKTPLLLKAVRMGTFGLNEPTLTPLPQAGVGVKTKTARQTGLVARKWGLLKLY